MSAPAFRDTVRAVNPLMGKAGLNVIGLSQEDCTAVVSVGPGAAAPVVVVDEGVVGGTLNADCKGNILCPKTRQNCSMDRHRRKRFNTEWEWHSWVWCPPWFLGQVWGPP